MKNSGLKAVFLDRDGIINEDTGYPVHPEGIRFLPGIFEFSRAAVERGYLLVVVTNQSGVAKGYFTEQDVEKLHAWMGERFALEGCPVAGFYFCPFHKDAVHERYRTNLHMRKPEPGMLLKAAEDFGIDIARSVMVGDKPSDRIRLEGLRSIIVRSRYSHDDFDVESLDAIIPILDTRDSWG